MINQQATWSVPGLLRRPAVLRQPKPASKTPRRWAGRIEGLDEEQWDRRLLLALAELRDPGLTDPWKEEGH
jgi:hypothetical protein